MPSHAFLIGNWTFDHPELVGDNLKYPENDIRVLTNALSGKTLDTFVIDGSQNKIATEMIDDLNRFVKKPDPDDLLVVYFSGHGFPADGHLCLATKDTDKTNPNKHVACSTFVNAVRNAKSQRILIILDCCYSGLAGKALVEPRGPARTLLEQTVQPLGFHDHAADATSTTLRYRDREKEIRGATRASKGIFLLTATESLQLAQGKPETQLGLFTSHVIAGLTGSALVRTGGEYGQITACSVFDYALQKMRGEQQTPQLFVFGADAPDLLITQIHDLIEPVPTCQPPTLWQEASVFSSIGPVYILGESYEFLEWNAAFQHLVATPFRLRRGEHVKAFLIRLENWESEVKGHSVREFPAGVQPDVDTESLQFLHPTYGLVVAQKFASRLRQDRRFWCVSLNVTFVQRGNLWKSIMNVVQTDFLWSRYAECYDTVISSFSQNKALVAKVVDQIGLEPLQCLDIGAGTGSTTLELLRRNAGRRVHAVEPNRGMVARLRQNLEASDKLDRVEISYADCLGALANVKDESYDACVLMNVVFALDDPVPCLKEIRRVLKWNGVLSLSTSTTDTNIEELFSAIYDEMSKKPNWEEVKDQFEEARARNREMEGMITRYSEEDLRRFLETAGFNVLNTERKWYVNCVVVVRAVKRKQTYLPPDTPT